MSVIIERVNTAAQCGVSALRREIKERFPARERRRKYALQFVKAFRIEEGNPRFYTARNDARELVGVMLMTLWNNPYRYGFVEIIATDGSTKGTGSALMYVAARAISSKGYGLRLGAEGECIDFYRHLGMHELVGEHFRNQTWFEWNPIETMRFAEGTYFEATWGDIDRCTLLSRYDTPRTEAGKE